MSDEISFEDCCRIILEQGPPVREAIAPDKPDYRRDLLTLLNKEFGIDWNDNVEIVSSPIVWGADGRPRNPDVPSIARSLVQRYGGITDPFTTWFGYTFARGEPEVWKAHQAGLADAAMVLRQHFLALFRDLLLLRWPKAAQRTTSWATLQALRLVVPTYDPDDL